MARYVGLGEEEPSEDSERRVAIALRRLPDDWIVLHHVSWQSRRGGRQGDGEADFVVLHPKRGLLVLEVKGGGIEIHEGRWSSINRRGERNDIKNPYEQATDSKHALLGWLKERGLAGRVRIGHAVAFPHMAALPNVGPAGPPAISFAKPDLDAIAATIDRCFEHWSLEAKLAVHDVTKLVGLLAPTVSVTPNLAGKLAEAEKELLLFTADQVEAFAGLRASRGGLILGGAGTGKTILAVARAQQLAKDGFRTLLVCYNELLGADLARRTASPPALTAGTFHSICLAEAAKARLPVPAQRNAGWWEQKAPELLIEACATTDTSFDAVVVDEAQDFSPLWLDALRCLIGTDKDAPFFEFADPRQDIWARAWSTDSRHAFVYELTRNMRNTRPIAERVAATIATICKDRGVIGPQPIWRVTNGAPRESDVIASVERLLDEGLTPVSIVVLCEDAALANRLRERSIGAYSFGRWGSRGVPVESISRFKGLDAAAVVLALAENKGPAHQAQAYVGISRARSLLAVVGSQATRNAVNWP
ncbi:NERD domain-containing protein [Ancylobacter sp. MQZ15Z-1]|uniref:NERD domain-containing protein n=1 Tax=Ancylobacter mangrovi TaxID=2972472 RepID=A0A9X2PBC9_9HYPH|nr:NERD domain-containing protein [Ancylobacter mangrovi]MCS0495584.1 NERD domain-containing protein [Ancylobacter mangrovi]